jgi:hypothetical protein
LEEGLVKLELLRVVDLVEFDDEIGIEVEKDGDAVDDLLHYFEGALRLHDGRLAKSLLEVVDDLNVALLGLLHVLVLAGLTHSVTPAQIIYQVIDQLIR